MYVAKYDNLSNLAIVKWVDNKEVLIASNYVGDSPVETIKRYSKDVKAKVDIPCPRLGPAEIVDADLLAAQVRQSTNYPAWTLDIAKTIVSMASSDSGPKPLSAINVVRGGGNKIEVRRG